MPALTPDELKKLLSWQAIVSTFTDIDVTADHCDIEVLGDDDEDDLQIKITSTPDIIQKIKTQLTENLASQAAINACLPYKISTEEQHENQSLQTEVTPSDMPQVTDIDSAKKFLHDLWGQATFDALCFNLDACFSNGTFESGVLYSKMFPAAFEGFYRSLRDSLLLYFNNVAIDAIRRVINSPDESLYTLHPNPVDIPKSTPQQHVNLAAHGAVKNCFNVLTPESGTQFSIHLAALLQLVYPPEFNLEQINTDSATLTFSQKHFMRYFRQKLQGETLLRVFKADQTPMAYPIIFPDRDISLEPEQRTHTLVIDKSGSMRDNFDDLKTHVIEYLTKLKERDPGSTVRLVFFATEIAIKEFILDDANFPAIEAFIQQQRPEACTNLLRATADEMRYAYSLASDPNKRVASLIVFTDGIDNSGEPNGRLNTAAQQEICNSTQIFAASHDSIPAMFLFGFGNDYDATQLDDIARSMNGHFADLRSIQAFSDELMPEVDTLPFKRIIKQIILNELFNGTIEIPVLQSGQPQTVAIALPFSELCSQVAVDGQSCTISLPDEAAIPAGTDFDQLHTLCAEYLQLARAAHSSNKSRTLSQFDDCDKQIVAIQEDLDPQLLVYQFAAYCRTELGEYREKINSLQDPYTERELTAIHAMVRRRQGCQLRPPAAEQQAEQSHSAQSSAIPAPVNYQTGCVIV